MYVCMDTLPRNTCKKNISLHFHIQIINMQYELLFLVAHMEIYSALSYGKLHLCPTRDILGPFNAISSLAPKCTSVYIHVYNM